MTLNPMLAYRILLHERPDNVEPLILNEFPEGVSKRWCGALLDIALTDYYEVNRSPGVDLDRRLSLAALIIDIVKDASRDPVNLFVFQWSIRLARKASEAGSACVRDSLEPRAVAKMIIDVLQVELGVDLADDALPQGGSFEMAKGVADGRLGRMRAILPELNWLSSQVSDDHAGPMVARLLELLRSKA